MTHNHKGSRHLAKTLVFVMRTKGLEPESGASADGTSKPGRQAWSQ